MLAWEFAAEMAALLAPPWRHLFVLLPKPEPVRGILTDIVLHVVHLVKDGQRTTRRSLHACILLLFLLDAAGLRQGLLERKGHETD